MPSATASITAVRAVSIISVSSDSSLDGEDLNLEYPADAVGEAGEPVITDLLSPVRLFVLVDDVDVSGKLQFYDS